MRALPLTPERLALTRRLARERSHVPSGYVLSLLADYDHTAVELRACRAQLADGASGGAVSPAEGNRP